MLPFRIEFTQRAIDDLHRRIDATRWPELPYETGWSTGTNDRVLRDLVRYWRQEYDWWAAQERLNGLAHLRGPIEGEEMHCVVYTGPGSERRLPVLLLHGWPGSFVEFLEAAPLLAQLEDGRPAFDVVVPSLPGYGFSQAPREPGMHPGRIAERMHLLMRELGYERYGVQGGDWGGIIAPALAQRHPEAVVALHVNFAVGGQPPGEAEMSAEEREWREQRRRFEGEETGYSRLQGTRPQTLAYAQHDSPVGLLAWILEKFWVWSDHGADEVDGLWETFDRDALLTNVMVYWLTGSILSAARLYYATGHMNEPLLRGRVEAPTGFARFPGEPWCPPREVIERSYNLVRYTEMARGGHFAAMEQPALFAQEVGAFFAEYA
jgi:epoxide hydrolase